MIEHVYEVLAYEQSMGTHRVLSPGVKQPRCEGLLTPTYIEARNEWNYTSTPV